VNWIYNNVPKAQQVNMWKEYQKKLYLGQWQYITKIYPVNAICLLKQNKCRIKVIIIHVNSELPINTDTCQKTSHGIVSELVISKDKIQSGYTDLGMAMNMKEDSI
jgi:hypothetical protein